MAKMCQSCSMPRNKDPEGGGSEMDGTKSAKYCSMCYDKGAFINPTTNVAEFQAHCVQAMHGKGMPKVIAWIMTRGIPRLERWKA